MWVWELLYSLSCFAYWYAVYLGTLTIRNVRGPLVSTSSACGRLVVRLVMSTAACARIEGNERERPVHS